MANRKTEIRAIRGQSARVFHVFRISGRHCVRADFGCGTPFLPAFPKKNGNCDIERRISMTETGIPKAKTEISITGTVISETKMAISLTETAISESETAIPMIETGISQTETIISLAGTVISVSKTARTASKTGISEADIPVSEAHITVPEPVFSRRREQPRSRAPKQFAPASGWQ